MILADGFLVFMTIENPWQAFGSRFFGWIVNGFILTIR